MLILASKSPRRRELLARMGLEFTVRAAEIDETMDPASPLAAEIARVSAMKAEAVLPFCHADDVIVSADTLVCIGGRRLGKPKDAEDAFAMLRLLSGAEHQVISGLTVRQGAHAETQTVTTTLRFRPLSDAEIRAYIATGEPMDKAGAYGIQGGAAMFTEAIHGDYYNVMGLPVCTLTLLLRRFGIPVLGTL